jgi:hypothetical protein
LFLEIKLLKVCFKSIFGDLKLHNFHIVVFFWNVSFYVILREFKKNVSLDFYVCCVIGEEDF